MPSYPAVVNRLQFTSPQFRKESNKSRGSSRFHISKKRDIQKLPLLKGVCVLVCVCVCVSVCVLPLGQQAKTGQGDSV